MATAALPSEPEKATEVSIDACSEDARISPGVRLNKSIWYQFFHF